MIGRTLSHYKVLEEISRGGMGIVYRAVDLKLDREVALKVLPPELVADPERKRRFIQEAKAAAKLEHPHIGVVHEIDEAEGVTFIVMELIEGERLRDILERGRLPLHRTLELVTEVAEGLSGAHDKGIVHRDLKPANIMVTENGHAKIIDFGLAKLVEPLAGDESEAETVAKETDPGHVMGTVSYMSPEQARGKKVDHRSDIFTFGIVLHEMLTGQRPFERDSGIDTLHAILHQTSPRLPEAGLEASGKSVSELQSIVDKCLTKYPEERYQSMRDVLVDLQGPRDSVSVREKTRLRVVGTKWPKLAGIAIGIIGLALIAYYLGFRKGEPPGIGASGRPAIAVMYFEDHTGVEEIGWLSKGLPSMLLTGLAQTPGLDVVSSARIHEILKQVGQETLDTIDESLVLETARRAGAGAVVVGSIFKSGPEIRIDVRVEDVGSGKLLSAHSVQGEDVFPLVDQLTSRIRTSLHMTDVPAGRTIAEVTTPSLEAYHLYSEALEARKHNRDTDARKLLEKAIELDPSFAMAYFELSYLVDLETATAEQYRQKVLEHLDRLPERERLLVQGRYAMWPEGNTTKAVEFLETLIARYPDEEEAYVLLSSVQYQLGAPEQSLATLERGVRAIPRSGSLHNQYGYRLIHLGRYQEALHEFETYAEISPEEPNPYDSLAEAYLIIGQPERAIEKYARSLEVDPSFFMSHEGRAWGHAMLGHYDEALSEIVKLEQIIAETGYPELDHKLIAAFLFSRAGRYREAEERILQGFRLAENLESHALMHIAFQSLSSLLALEREDFSGILENTNRMQQLLSTVTHHYSRKIRELVYRLLAGTAEARTGNIEAARTHLDAQKAIYDPNENMEKWWYHALKGEIALATGDLDAAEASFAEGEPKLKMEFSMSYSLFNVLANCLLIRDGLARVHEARGDLSRAIVIYRKLNTPDISSKWTAVLEPRYVLQQARLLARSGDEDAARKQYERFLSLWKNADPELPELEEARRYVGR